jgi:N-acetylmuramoyl-L-alanine amidase
MASLRLFTRPLRPATAACAGLFLALAAGAGQAAPLPPAEARLAALVRAPTIAEWRTLERFDRTLTRQEFEERLDRVFDPWHGLRPYLKMERDAAVIYPDAGCRGAPLARVDFAPIPRLRQPLPVNFRRPGRHPTGGGPQHSLAGLHVVIEPADIGGAWATMEDRSVEFPGYGRICEGDLNLVVARLLRAQLERLGADVFLVRDREEPILPIARDHLLDAAERLLRYHADLLPVPLREWVAGLRRAGTPRLQFAAGMLLTKAMETRARAELVRRSFRPDITIVLQHDATPDSAEGRLAPTNRNIFFVDGAYLPAELRDPWQRFRLLTKLLENVTPVEATVAADIAARFHAVTGFPPVLYGDSANTRLVVPGNPYVVARNLDFSREHGGPVVVTEPYFMNQPVTLARLLAGDYSGHRVIAGRRRASIFREYADCVATGLVDAYGPRSNAQ